jgi:hypothetical protein
VSIESQTNRPACFVSACSVNTVARMKRQLCHQGAQTSTNTGMFASRALVIACA